MDPVGYDLDKMKGVPVGLQIVWEGVGRQESAGYDASRGEALRRFGPVGKKRYLLCLHYYHLAQLAELGQT